MQKICEQMGKSRVGRACALKQQDCGAGVVSCMLQLVGGGLNLRDLYQLGPALLLVTFSYMRRAPSPSTCVSMIEWLKVHI